MTLVQIPSLTGCANVRKNIKNSSSLKLGVHIYDISLFLFQSDKNCGCCASIQFPLTYNGKKESGNLRCLIWDI